MLTMTSEAARQLAVKIESKQAIVAVIGLGYVGLPLLDAYVQAGFSTIGFDVDESKAEQLNSGHSYIAHISSSKVRAWLDQKRFRATCEMAQLAEADVILICVPTPLTETRDPDLQYVESTTQAISKTLKLGQLIILESTTYPGTTRELVVPILNASGLVAGRDYFVAFSPEREDPGNANFTAGTIPKVVGGVEPTSLDLAVAFYSSAISSVVPVSSCEVAEACKILENTYRSVNIAMINELKMLFAKIGIDVWEVIDAAKTKPFGFQAFYPGPGLGGHCIPIDPFYLSWVARKHDFTAKFIELSGEINSHMPEYVVARVVEALNSHSKPVRGSNIGILGVAYKRDIDDPRESPSFRLMELLGQQGAVLSYCDPHVPTLPKMRHYDVPELASESISPQYLASLDCVIIATDHSIFDWTMVVQNSQLVIDTRNATQAVASNAKNVWKA